MSMQMIIILIYGAGDCHSLYYGAWGSADVVCLHYASILIYDGLTVNPSSSAKGDAMTQGNIIHPPAMAHGELSQVLENIWFVQGSVKLPMFMPVKTSRSMTVIKNASSDELTLVNSMRLSEEGLKKLEQLGRITNVIRLAGFHGRDDAFYQEKYHAKVYAIKGQYYSRKFEKTPLKPEDGFFQPDEWLTEYSLLPIDGASLKIIHSSRPSEALLLLERDGGILIAGDVLQNTAVADEYMNWMARFMMKRMGFFKPYNVGPAWLEHAKPNPEEVRSILDLQFEHVLPAHGVAVIGNAREKYSPALLGELKGCHA